MSARRRWAALVVTICAAGLGVGAVHPELLRVILLLALLPAVVGVGLRSPSGLIYTLTIWLAALGFVRRIVDTATGAGAGGLGDPLLLVEPAVMVVLTVIAFRRGALRERTRIANAVLVLNLLAIVEVLNPLQGTPLVGAAGLIFLLVPMLAFWVGRSLVDDHVMARLFALLGILAVPAVLYGLFQQVRGLPSWDEAWVISSGYNALNVGGTIRAFGTFSAASEYATFLAVGIVICAAALVRPRLVAISLAVGGLLAFGVFYESSRSIVLLCVVALMVMWAARHHLRPVLAALAGVVGVTILFVLAAHTAPVSSATGAGSQLAQHQLAGLANPLNAQDSTLTVHFSEMLSGLRSTFLDPFGHGTGSVSRAAPVFGSNSHGTEVDPSKFGVSLGLPGLLAYLVVVVSGLLSAYRLASRTPRWTSLVALGVLVVTFLQWGNGGQYAVAWLPWLVLGWIDGRMDEKEELEAAAQSLGRFYQVEEPRS